MENTKIGVYEILNIKTGKRYIGSTTRSFNKRWDEHSSFLKKNKHHSQYLQIAWVKYGEECFEFNILEIVENKEKCIEREQYWIDYYTSANVEFGYNVAPNSSSMLGFKHSPISKEKMRQNNLGKSCSEETKLKLSIVNSGVNNPNYGKKMSDEQKEKLSKSNEIYTYKVISPEKEEFTISNLNKFCKEFSLNAGHMNNVCNGRRKQYKGWLVEKLEPIQ